MSKSKIFLYFCSSFIAGIFTNSIIFIPQFLMLGILILSLLLISVFWKRKKLVVFGFCFLFLILGVFNHQRAERKIFNNELRKQNDAEREIALTGIVIKEPDVRENNIKLTIQEHNSKSRVLITSSRYPEYDYGDNLKITGFLQTPLEFEDFNYKDYLAKDSIYSVMYKPKIELLKKNQGSFFYAKILSFKKKMRQTIYSFLSPPQSSILGAMLLGDKSRMSQDLKEKLNTAGVRHITAVSGMHIVVLSGVLMSLLIGLGLGRGRAFYFTIFFITLFIIMTGAQSSGVRAGIMAGLLLLGQKIGRRGVSSRALVFAGALMLAFNPLLLFLDVGFQLSFLAVLGIIYLGPAFSKWLGFIPEQSFINLRSALVMTFSAYIFTLPILIYNFGRISIIAPITNVLIAPLVYWIMLFGFIFALLGMIFQPLAWILSWPVWLLLTYIVKIVDLFSKIPWASLAVKISWHWLAIFYLTIFVIAHWLYKKFTKPAFLG